MSEQLGRGDTTAPPSGDSLPDSRDAEEGVRRNPLQKVRAAVAEAWPSSSSSWRRSRDSTQLLPARSRPI
eukprot:CAMPEP_0183347246 /NCGR_PEP_ID=MMETSP0164_2-20130417/12122_1 /TAXON_ID=221442 /ORGANISM="Coccolithus pelagicus ssp braarudi, Strain PLY182g" /LENGTH=69 /DNA_ID=CAMNT_0025518637 /DNA_START=755 /DNA_END=961 /DNA_ORIENTATION=+